MNLFILRHASAGERRVNPILDTKRPLDKEGKLHCLRLGHVLNAMRYSFDLVVSSPLKRSLQTAQLVATEMGYESKIVISPALSPTATFDDFQQMLRDCQDYENVLVVGHNPNLTSFLMELVGTGDSGGRVRIRVRKGAIARLSLQRGPAMLQWLLDPRLVRALYATSTKSSRRKTSRK